MAARARRVLDQAVEHAINAGYAVAHWVMGIWRRVTSEPGYAEAVAALVIAAADLFVGGLRLRRLLHEAASTFVIVVRSLMRDQGMPDTYWQ